MDKEVANMSDLNTSIESEFKELDSVEDEDVGMTEEEDEETVEEDDEEDEEEATRTVKSPSKARRKARANDDDEDDDEDEMKDDTADEEEDEDEDEDEEEDDEDEEERAKKKAAPTKIDLSDPDSMLRMLQSLPEEEARRHEHFRRSNFDRGAIKRIMARAIQESIGADKRPPSVTQVMAIVMAGMTKIFVGELTAEARRIMEAEGETGPIQPRHLREAHRKYYKRRPLARGRNFKRLLR